MYLVLVSLLVCWIVSFVSLICSVYFDKHYKIIVVMRMKMNNIILFLLITILLLVNGIDNHKKNSNDNSDIKDSYYEKMIPSTAVNYINQFYDNFIRKSNVNNNNNNIDQQLYQHQQQLQRQQQNEQEIKQNRQKTSQTLTGQLEDKFFQNKYFKGDRKLQRVVGPQPTRFPTPVPTFTPTPVPTRSPSSRPTSRPSSRPSAEPSVVPTAKPTKRPTPRPTFKPSNEPSFIPTVKPSSIPSSKPTSRPSSRPSVEPTSIPTSIPTGIPSSRPTRQPTSQPLSSPSSLPSSQPSSLPSSSPSTRPTSVPSTPPTTIPTTIPTSMPTTIPTVQPTISLGYDDDEWFSKNTSPEGYWTSIATNSKGNYVVATQAGSSINDGSIYISSNYGKLWSQTSAPLNLWSDVSISETGKYIVATASKVEDLVFFDQNLNTKKNVYISTNFGNSWSSLLPLGHYGECRIRGNGTIGILSYDSHQSTSSKLLLSRDYGGSWLQLDSPLFQQGRNIIVNGQSMTTGPPFLIGVCSSKTAQYIAVIESSNLGRLFVSSNNGSNWNYISNTGPWSSIACSDTGQYMIAGQGYTKVIYEGQDQEPIIEGGFLYRSSDFGVSWNMITSFGRGIFGEIVSDSTGKYLSVVYEIEPNYNALYVSSDFGVTWTASIDVPISKDYSIASTSYGRFLYACSKHRASTTPSNIVKGRILMYRGMAEPEIPLH